MESDLDQESGEGSLRRGHLRKDLKEVRGQMGEHCRQREQQVESPGVRECLNLEAQQVHTAVWWEQRCGRTLRMEMRQVGTGAMSQSIVNPYQDLAFYSKINGNHRGALSKEHLGLT